MNYLYKMRRVFFGMFLGIFLLISALNNQLTAFSTYKLDELEVWTNKEAYRVGETVVISAVVWHSSPSDGRGEIGIVYINDTEASEILSIPFLSSNDIFNFSWVQEGSPGTYKAFYQPYACHCIFFWVFFVYEPPGDVNFDGIVNILDLVNMSSAYGSRTGDSNWNPVADIAQPYGIVDILDLVTCTGYYGEKYPEE